MLNKMTGINMKNMEKYEMPMAEILDVEISADILSASGDNWEVIED